MHGGGGGRRRRLPLPAAGEGGDGRRVNQKWRMQARETTQTGGHKHMASRQIHCPGMSASQPASQPASQHTQQQSRAGPTRRAGQGGWVVQAVCTIWRSWRSYCQAATYSSTLLYARCRE